MQFFSSTILAAHIAVIRYWGGAEFIGQLEKDINHNDMTTETLHNMITRIFLMIIGTNL